MNIYASDEDLETLDISKLRAYKACPRKFMYNYVLCMQKDESNIHLEFGVAWHLAKEALLHGSSVDDAFALFLSHYREHYSEVDDTDRCPKDPTNAYKALNEYKKKYSYDSWNVLGTEIAGRAIVNPTQMLSFKIDAIVQDLNTREIWIVDHKTASRDTNLDEVWNMSDQMTAYIYAASEYLGTVAGAIVDVTVLRKTSNMHKRVYVRKSEEQLEKWRRQTSYYMSLVRSDIELAKKIEYERIDICSAFVENSESCTMYGRCPYMDLCLAVSNPFNLSNLPSGFRLNVWNPHTEQKPKLELTSEGIRPLSAETSAYYDNILAEVSRFRTERQNDIDSISFI